MGNHQLRIMRLALPVELIRQMDELILAGTGGYRTRAEFIVDAIQERVVELSISEEEDAGAPSAGTLFSTNSVDVLGGVYPSGKSFLLDHATESLGHVSRGFTVPDESAIDQVEGKPLFGLHNRDYPSIWALYKLAGMTRGGPLPIEQFYEAITQHAWEKGRELVRLERETGTKCTALFPTNSNKKGPAELAFRMFAVGDYRRVKSGLITTSGPFFEWRVARICHNGNGLSIGLTAQGWKLLEACEGITVFEPHSAREAETFLKYLEKYAKPDYLTLIGVLRSVGRNGSSRQNLLNALRDDWPAWSNNEVSTNAAGYVARAREWGLLHPKQTNGLYRLTDFGLDRLEN